MNLALAAVAEKIRRDKLRAAILAAVRAHFEVVADRRARVRRTEVYDVAARAAGVEIQTPPFCRLVQLVCRELGALTIAPGNRQMFLRLQRRAREWEPPRKLSPQQVGQLRRKWYARLRAEGFEDIENTRTRDRVDGLKRAVSGHADTPGWWSTRAAINTAFFDRAATWYWRQRRDLEIWGLYVLEGLSVDDIVARGVGLQRSQVADIVKAMRRAMETAGHRGEGEETSADGEGHAEDVDDG